MKPPDKFISYLRKSDNFFLAVHINPDADAVGSILALGEALKRIGKKITLYSKDKIPVFYDFLPGISLITHAPPSDIMESWTLILIDCNIPERAGIKHCRFGKSLVIDHHQTEKNFGDIKWIVPEASATGVLMFYVIGALGCQITKEIATCLYTAISYDTGTFRYPNTTAETFHVASELIKAGANPSLVANQLYNSWSGARFNLLIQALNAITICDDIAITTVDNQMLDMAGAIPADTENFVNFPNMMKSINVSILIKEADDNVWRVSLRSQDGIDVAKIAEKFEGGGHKNAAGFKVKDISIDNLKESLINEIAGQKNESVL